MCWIYYEGVITCKIYVKTFSAQMSPNYSYQPYKHKPNIHITNQFIC